MKSNPLDALIFQTSERIGISDFWNALLILHIKKPWKYWRSEYRPLRKWMNLKNYLTFHVH